MPTPTERFHELNGRVEVLSSTTQTRLFELQTAIQDIRRRLDELAEFQRATGERLANVEQRVTALSDLVWKIIVPIGMLIAGAAIVTGVNHLFPKPNTASTQREIGPVSPATHR